MLSSDCTGNLSASAGCSAKQHCAANVGVLHCAATDSCWFWAPAITPLLTSAAAALRARCDHQRVGSVQRCSDDAFFDVERSPGRRYAVGHGLRRGPGSQPVCAGPRQEAILRRSAFELVSRWRAKLWPACRSPHGDRRGERRPAQARFQHDRIDHPECDGGDERQCVGAIHLDFGFRTVQEMTTIQKEPSWKPC